MILGNKKTHTERSQMSREKSLDKVTAKPSGNAQQTTTENQDQYMHQISGLSNLNSQAHLNLRSHLSKTWEAEESTAVPIKNSINELWNEDFTQSKYIIS